MMILSNNYALRYSQEYLKNVNIDFEYMPAGVFQMCEKKPNIIISDNYHECLAASKDYPDIVFLGRELTFPNIGHSVPTNLLDELSTLSDLNINCPHATIGYFNEGRENNIDFISKLRSLGNVKIMGPGFCLEELDEFFPQRTTASFYKYVDFVGATCVEEVLKALFLNKPCIYSGYYPKTYNVDKLTCVDLKPFSGSVEYAWSLSHTVTWGNILNALGYDKESEELKQILNFEEEK